MLNELQSLPSTTTINYWRDKRGHEMDFILTKGGKVTFAIECKWSFEGFDPRNLISFRGHYQSGKNLVVCHNIDKKMQRTIKDIDVTFVAISDLPGLLL